MMATKKVAPEATSRLLVTQVRSAIGTKPKHRGTLRALGLRKIGASNVLPDRPEIRGMIARVPHLITVEVAPDEPNSEKVTS
jgi:large subunit ribosomal protein L30